MDHDIADTITNIIHQSDLKVPTIEYPSYISINNS
jgi:hypothetical protein